MAMVQLTESEIINGSTAEDDSHSSEHIECFNSRPASHCSSSSKQGSPSLMPSLQYSKGDLMKYSSFPLSQNWPSCLDPAYNNPTGKWDPERWFMNHRSDRSLPVEEPRSKRDKQDDSVVSHKRKSSDPKERIKEEKDDIVLSPQRRSFGTGCHVIQQSSLARRPGSPTDGRESENFRDPSRRIGSGRIMAREREQRDWERDREYGYGSGRGERRDRFDQDENEKDLRRYSNRYNRNDRRSRGRDRIDEVEPEWFSGGPTSQSDTIELVGFEDAQNEDENRKPTKKSGKRAKQNSRRLSVKSDEGEKVEVVVSEDSSSHKKGVYQEDSKPVVEGKTNKEETQDTNKSSNSGFDLDELFRMDWIPGLLQNESPPDNVSNEMGCSRFSQWFRRDSPLPDVSESRNNSRRSSLHEELIANVLNSIEPQLIIPSPTQNSTDNFFTPISPALSHSANYSVSQSSASNVTNKDILEMLQSASASNDSTGNGGIGKDPAKTVKELEDDLKRIVLGDKKIPKETSAFDKLVKHMSDSQNSPSTSMSMGPLDKSKALQEQDLLQDYLGGSQPTSVSPMMHPYHIFKEEKQPISQLVPGMPRSQYNQSNQQNQNEMFAHLMQQKQQEHQLQQMQHQQQLQQHQMQNHLQQQTHQGFTVDMLAKILGTPSQPLMSPTSSSLHQSVPTASLNRNDPQMINSVLQYQRQRELLTSMLKQQNPSQNSSQSNILQPMQQRRCPSTKEIPIQQTLGLPALGISPRQSPLPPEAITSGVPSQGRIPSPLVFGQQPPALSHAPAPIHPAVVQAISQNAATPNTLQVQNPVVLQRVPSPQELAVHTQSILQNALIKRKLEEQKENFRKRQEAQRTNSPVTSNKNGLTLSPHKVHSPLPFTPSSVVRKIQSEKAENKEQKSISQQNGNKLSGDVSTVGDCDKFWRQGVGDPRLSESVQNIQKMNSIGIPSSVECNFGAANNSHMPPSQNSCVNQVPRAVHGQSNSSQPRSIHGGMNCVGPSMVIPNQGRPIVKVGLSQGLNSSADLPRTNIVPNKSSVIHNKQFLPNSNQAHSMHHDVDPGFDKLAKFPWHHQISRQQNAASTMPQLQMAATYAALNRAPALNPHHPSLLRPVGIGSAGNIPASNINFPILRNTVQNPIRAQTNAINQLNHIGQLAALQLQRGAIDSRQLQALAQSQRLHPATLQQLLMNTQNQVTAAQAQVVAGFPGRDTKHQHLLPGQASTNRQSPVNLAKWFGNDVLKQKMPDMPPVSHQKALLVEEVERQQQSTVVHN